tara:strand:- start:234 stop:854 length:621 start_codon:yes stop_codon:yes gene_type:complete
MSKITNTQLHLVEAASAGSSTAGEGQIWVDTKTPNRLMFTDDTGIDCGISKTLSSLVTTTGGTAILFGGIPDGVSEVTIMYSGLSWNGTDDTIITLGDAGGLETAGYIQSGQMHVGTADYATTDTAFFRFASDVATENCSGMIILKLMAAATNLWSCMAMNGSDQAVHSCCAGTKALSGVLTQVNFTTTSSSNTIDANGGVSMEYS